MTQTFIITDFPQRINVGTRKIRFVAISCDANDKRSLQRLQPGGKAFIHIVVLVIISFKCFDLSEMYLLDNKSAGISIYIEKKGDKFKTHC